ncbi:hypothetical protein [Sphingomonas sp.]|uniref:hypothetical protein n=1 Tax=Sphingomonas sp. TaxID=28214 RepID=UPI002DE6421E|nr:hypothetical protein [Sphingomonas sp.]
MIDEILIGLIGGAVGEKLFGKLARRHRYITYAICIPILTVIGYLAVDQLWAS